MTRLFERINCNQVDWRCLVGLCCAATQELKCEFNTVNGQQVGMLIGSCEDSSLSDQSLHGRDIVESHDFNSIASS